MRSESHRLHEHEHHEHERANTEHEAGQAGPSVDAVYPPVGTTGPTP
jgi:hypothetical protein